MTYKYDNKVGSYVFYNFLPRVILNASNTDKVV